MANINGHEIFFGIVGQVDAPTVEDKLPSWFPNVEPINDLADHFGDDLSEYYVDVAFKLTSSATLYVYYRCYCNTADKLKILSSNGSTVVVSYAGSDAKVAYRAVTYNSDGTVYNYYNNNWSDTNLLLSNNFDSTKICVINKGKFFNISTYNLTFQML